MQTSVVNIRWHPNIVLASSVDSIAVSGEWQNTHKQSKTLSNILNLNIILVYSHGEFVFAAVGKDTHCVETVQYQCPPFMGWLCRREVQFQRKAIMRNLTQQFSKKY